MIQIENLTKSYSGFKALDNIHLNLHQSQAVSLLGANGSGKTTLIKSILGLVIPEKGSIRMNGKDIRKDWSTRAEIGYMPQIGRYPDNMTIEQVIGMIKELRKDTHTYDEDLIKGYKIDSIKHKTMRSLSGGTRQKVSACLAFLFSPAFYILDEPTAGLDPISSEILKEKIIHERSNNKLILITTHVLNDLEDTINHVIYLQEGRLLFFDSIKHLQELTKEEKLNKIIKQTVQHYQPN